MPHPTMEAETDRHKDKSMEGNDLLRIAAGNGYRVNGDTGAVP